MPRRTGAHERMKISVIIVNYNVRAYLEQCLRTVQEALKGIDGDVYVVDNLSTDGSVEMVREKFPGVKLIANTENVGFSRANNQAIRMSTAEYVVLLNPDTVVGEDVFRKVIAFMDTHPKAGGLGVKMIDGTGTFLPESKRGLPTPAVAFNKIIGLTRMFPRSRTFGRYHLGHLPDNETARIEILSGACMFLRKETLDKVGLLDESFFMYGEDIDLSYRITLGGYENWYFPETPIIHYNGESTKKSSVNYVFVFYNAMAIFAKKHFTRRGTDFFSLLINGSIYLSAAGAIVSRFLNRALLPIMDFTFMLVLAWSYSWWVGSGGAARSLLAIGGHVALLVALMALTGAYDRPVRLLNVAKGMALWLLYFLLRRAWAGMPASFLLDLSAVLLLGLAPIASRIVMHLLGLKGYSLRSLDLKRVLAIGSTEENGSALALLWQTHFGLGRQRQMSVEEVLAPNAAQEIARRIAKDDLDEVVFCAKDLRWAHIIELMEKLRPTGAMFKIAQPGREFIIGPNSIESLNDLYIMERYAVNSAAGRRTKRITDLALAGVFLVTAPLMLIVVKDRPGFVRNWWEVVRRRKSWVSYGPMLESPLKLPTLLRGVIPPTADQGPQDSLTLHRANIVYAKDYKAGIDLRAVWKGLHDLGRD